MTDATELDLDAIRARLDAATEGPWRVDEIARVWADRDPAGWDAFHIAACHDAVGRAGHDDEANAEFIAHARTDVERLLAALEAAESSLAGIAALLGRPNITELVRISGKLGYRATRDDVRLLVAVLERVRAQLGDATRNADGHAPLSEAKVVDGDE